MGTGMSNVSRHRFPLPCIVWYVGHPKTPLKNADAIELLDFLTSICSCISPHVAISDGRSISLPGAASREDLNRSHPQLYSLFVLRAKVRKRVFWQSDGGERIATSENFKNKVPLGTCTVDHFCMNSAVLFLAFL
jgi:hypothetical protein